MARFIFLIFLLAFQHCGKQSSDQYEEGLSLKYVNVDGQSRRYKIYIPQDAEGKALPVVFVLHGGGGNIENMTGENGYKAPFKLWMDIAEKEKLIIVYVEGLNGAYDKPSWNDCRADAIINSDADDVLYISTLIDEISREYNVDHARIYATGYSNGGIMSLRLAVELPGRIAAVAVFGAAMANVSECVQPSQPVSVMFLNGTDDAFLPYEGGTVGKPPDPKHGSVLSVEASVKLWTEINKTDTVALEYTFPDLDFDDGGVVVKSTYSNGANGTEVVLYRINGGGHLPPSIMERYSLLAENYFGKQNHDIELAEEVWKFFRNKVHN